MTDTKMCPYCGEDIKSEAIKCKHCQSMLNKEDDRLVGVVAPSRPQQAASKTNKPILKQWWVWAAVIIVLFVAVLSMGGGDDKTAPKPSTEDAAAAKTDPDTKPEPEPESKMQFIKINEKTTFSEWEYKVIDVQYHNTLKDERARGTYAVFMLEATNNSNVPRNIGHMFQIEDDKSRVFAFDSSASLAHHHTFRVDIWHLEDIGPSFTGIIPVAFDIPDDAKILFFYPKGIRDEDFKNTSVIMIER